MKKTGKIILWSLLVLIVIAGAAVSIFLYKVLYGFPVFYETKKPTINFPPNQPAILVFSKTTGFRHAESIDASKAVFARLARQNNWFVYQTEEGGVFNAEQLRHFKVVIFDNSTGRVLNDQQQEVLSHYVEAGGSLVGIHGAGDNSHRWTWYETNLLGTRFSHHPLDPNLQKTNVHVETAVDTTLTRNLPSSWANEDEWYVFTSQPKGVRIVAYIDGKKIISSGNFLWISDKNFGMGPYHPVAWYRSVGKGKTFYTSMGHSARVWQNANFVRLIENALQWTSH